MKKNVLLLSVLMALPIFHITASAQEDLHNPLVVAKTPGEKGALELLAHIGYGYNATSTPQDLEISYSSEFFINIINIKAYPIPALGIEIGVDYKTNGFESKMQAFKVDNGAVKVMPYGEKITQPYTKNFSRLRTNTFSAPAMLKLNAGPVSIGVGAEANLNLTGRIKDKYFVDGKKVKDIEKNVPFNKFNYDLVGTISYEDTGIYVRYYPKNSRLLTDGSIDLSFFTVGVIFGM